MGFHIGKKKLLISILQKYGSTLQNEKKVNAYLQDELATYKQDAWTIYP